MEIKLTIIIPVYNRPERIIKALDSIPVRSDIEVIVIDDCSTDNTLEVLKNYKKLPLTILRTFENSGPGIARNAGLDCAQGEFITFLDSDDWFITQNLEAILNSIDQLEQFDIIWFIRNIFSTGRLWNGSYEKIVFQGNFLKRSLVDTTRYNDKRWMEDRDFVNEIKAKNPIEVECMVPIYVYDRRLGGPNQEEDSLTYQYLKGNGWHW